MGAAQILSRGPSAAVTGGLPAVLLPCLVLGVRSVPRCFSGDDPICQLLPAPEPAPRRCCPASAVSLLCPDTAGRQHECQLRVCVSRLLRAVALWNRQRGQAEGQGPVPRRTASKPSGLASASHAGPGPARKGGSPRCSPDSGKCPLPLGLRAATFTSPGRGQAEAVPPERLLAGTGSPRLASGGWDRFPVGSRVCAVTYCGHPVFSPCGRCVRVCPSSAAV